jgi:hypothetical protein
MKQRWMVFGVVLWAVCYNESLRAQEWKSGVEWQEPPVVTPGATNDAPPSDAIVLFDGSNLDAWEHGDKWLVENGVAIPRETEILTKQHFGDLQLHIEWATPSEVRGEGQGRGNSGIFLMDQYEVQILDSYQNATYFDGQAASIYKQTPPQANVMRPPGEWNTYEIIFNAPRFKSSGALERPGYVTVLHNGVLVLNHFELLGSTSYLTAPEYVPHAETGPISLQFHGDPVRFRNIWVRELKPAVGRRTRMPFNIEPPKRNVPAAEGGPDGNDDKSGDDSRSGNAADSESAAPR